MDRFKSNFKKPTSDHVDNKNRRVVAMGKNRKETRGKSFAAGRNVPEAEPEEVVENLDQNLTVNNENKLPETGLSHSEYMKVRLQKWKEEKQKQKLEKDKIMKRTRPPFKAGIVHHDDSAVVIGSNVTSVQKSVPVTKAYDFSAFQASVFRPMPQNTRAAASTIVVSHVGSKNGSTKTQVAPNSSTKKQQPNVQMRSLRSRNIPSVNTPNPASKSATLLPHKRQIGNVTPHITATNTRPYNRVTPFRFGQTSSSVAAKTPKSSKKENKKADTLKEPVETKSQPTVKTPSIKVAPRISRNKASAQELTKVEPSLPIKGVLPISVSVSQPTLKTPSIKVTPRISRNKASAQEPKNVESSLPIKVVLPISADRKSRSKVTAAAATTLKSSLPEVFVTVKPEEVEIEEEKEHDCPYFRRILATTITELEQQCQHWEHEQESGGDKVTEVAREQLLLATGMARLLIREKFAQFRGLIENCEANSTTTKTTCTDLQGFWDMIYLQVFDINNKFKELEYMKKNNWAPLETHMRNRVVQKKKVTAKPKPAPPKGRSNFKAFLAAAKKTTGETAEGDIETSVPVTNGPAVGRRSLMRSSTGIYATKRTMSIDSPRASAIVGASRIAKVAGRKSFTLDDSFSTANITPSLLDGEKSPRASFYNSPQRKSLRSKLPGISDEDLPKATPLRGILKKTEASGVFKKAVLFNAALQEQPNVSEDDVLVSPKASIIHTYGSRSHHSLSVSPVKDKFDALILSPSYIKNKVPSLKTKPIVDQLETLLPHNPFADMDIAFRGGDDNNSSRKRTPTPFVVRKSEIEYDGESSAPKKLFKPPTPYVARKGRRSGRIEIVIDDEVVDANMPGVLEPVVPSSLTPVITPEAKGRKHRYSPYGGRRASLHVPNTPDLISWDTPESKGVRKSVRIRKSVVKETS